jgi:hypothetical protein
MRDEKISKDLISHGFKSMFFSSFSSFVSFLLPKKRTEENGPGIEDCPYFFSPFSSALSLRVFSPEP